MNKRSKTGFPSILKATLVLSAYLILIAIKGCNSGDHQQQDPIDLYQYNNPAPDFFFDQGSWFGIQLPEGGKAGIAAPLILSDSNGYRFREPIIGLSVSEGDLPAPFKTANFNLPGRLVQILDTNGLEVLITTIFADHQTAIQQINISNISGSNKKISLELNFPRPDSTNNNRLWFYDLGNAQLLLETESELFPLENICQLQIIIQPEGKFSTYLAIRHRFKGDKAFDPYDFDGSANDLIENEKRWKGYILPYINLDSKKQCLAVKCIQTLINNWRSAAGELRHAGLFPSYAYRGFHGFWAWDSWKHAVALATFEPTLAKDQIRAMYDFQDDAGMIADCIFRDTIIENHNWRNTKPPLSAWAVFKVFEKTGDTGFVKEMLPKLVKYHAWWYKNRDHNNNSLCEYGSTDGTRIAAAWESGMDNAVRFDSARLVKINQSAWSLNQESIDLNAFLYAEKMYLSKLAKIIEDKALVEKYNSRLPVLKNRIQAYFYDSVSGYFYDKSTTDQSFIKVIGPEAWIVLWAKIATKEQAKQIIDKIMDPAHFNTYLPFPTLSASHPQFNPQNGYWRGPVWIDQAWFALEGMKNYGYDEQYHEMLNKLLNNADGLLAIDQSIRENYDPINGQGLNATHFSWSAVHLLLLLQGEL